MVRWTTYIIFSKAFTLRLIKVSQISYAPNQPCVGRLDRPSPIPGLNLILWHWRINLYTALSPFSCPMSQAFSCKPPLVSGLYILDNRVDHKVAPETLVSSSRPNTHSHTERKKNECKLIQCIFEFSIRKSKLGLNPCRIWGWAIKQTAGVKSSLF